METDCKSFAFIMLKVIHVMIVASSCAVKSHFPLPTEHQPHFRDNSNNDNVGEAAAIVVTASSESIDIADISPLTTPTGGGGDGAVVENEAVPTLSTSTTTSSQIENGGETTYEI